jgi:hypothetical protein
MSQDFPTYGRGDDEPREQPEHAPEIPPAERYGDQPRYGDPSKQRQNSYGTPAEPGPYGQPPYGQPPHGQFGQGQFGQGQYAPHDQGQFGQGQYGQSGYHPGGYPPGQSGHGQFAPSQYTPSQYGAGQYAPGQYTPGQFGQPSYEYGQVGTHLGPVRTVDPNPRAAKVALIAGIVAAFYGLLALSIQRTALREIAQAPGSELNHPLRTDVIDTIGQLSVAILAGAALTLWIRDLLARRKQGRSPAIAEYVGLGLIAVGAVFILIWMLMIASTGFGSDDATTGRLPSAYGYGGFGLLLVGAGLFMAYRVLRPDLQPVVQSAPTRPPWE